MEFAAVALLAILGAFTVALVHREPRVKRSGVWRTRRVLKSTSVSPIAELVDGKLACVVGTVEIDVEPLRSVLSRRPCVAYEIIEWRRGVRRAIVPFFVADATGRVRVDAGDAALLSPPVQRGETFEERIIEPGTRVRLVGSVRIEPAVTGEREHGFREGATAATLTGTARFPLLVDVEPE
jgi:hypothetical protein